MLLKSKKLNKHWYQSKRCQKCSGKYEKGLSGIKCKSVEIKNWMDGLKSWLEKTNKSEDKFKGLSRMQYIEQGNEKYEEIKRFREWNEKV